MTQAEFHRVYPLLFGWIQKTISTHARLSRTVSAFSFPRLPFYYSPNTMATASVVVVSKVPVPPLSAIGLAQFSSFENSDMHGITYLDTYFVRADQVSRESLHFHELVHVVQWRLLGPEQFLAIYADGLERFGYRQSPLEVIAYDLQARFEREQQPFDAEAACYTLLKALFQK